MNNTLLLTKQDKEQFLFWVATLMSGVFEKGKSSLNPSKDYYCCLGIGAICTIPEESLKKSTLNPELIKGGMPSQQEEAPRWLINVNQDFANKTECSLVAMNDEDESHKTIGEKLLEVYKEELNNI